MKREANEPKRNCTMRIKTTKEMDWAIGILATQLGESKSDFLNSVMQMMICGNIHHLIDLANKIETLDESTLSLLARLRK